MEYLFLHVSNLSSLLAKLLLKKKEKRIYSDFLGKMWNNFSYFQLFLSRPASAQLCMIFHCWPPPTFLLFTKQHKSTAMQYIPKQHCTLLAPHHQHTRPDPPPPVMWSPQSTYPPLVNWSPQWNGSPQSTLPPKSTGPSKLTSPPVNWFHPFNWACSQLIPQVNY